MNDIIQSATIAFKWESYRNTVKRFFLIDKEKGEAEYMERMAMLQSIIKKYAEKKGIEHLNAIIEISGKQDGMLALQFLAAGYELISGSDFTENYGG